MARGHMHRSGSDVVIVPEDDFVLTHEGRSRRSIAMDRRTGGRRLQRGKVECVDGGAAAVAGVSRADDGRFVGILSGWGRVSCYTAGRRQETRRVVDGLPRWLI